MQQPIFRSASSASTISPATDLALTLLGPSHAMSQLWTQVRRLAPHIRTVLLTGEPDCGQAATARLLLDLSSSPKRPFVECAAADAERRLEGPSTQFALPLDAFLFIPDLDHYSLLAQEALLRLLRHRRARPFTVIAATAERLQVLVSVGRFSPELAEMLDSVQLPVPPLRERAEDIPMLVGLLLGKCAQDDTGPLAEASEEFLRAAMAHSWSGNLREMERVLRSLAAECRGKLNAQDLERTLSAAEPLRSAEPGSLRMVSLDTVVHEHISAVLRACRGNKLRASEVLGISRSTLYRMLDTAAMQHNRLPLAS